MPKYEDFLGDGTNELEMEGVYVDEERENVHLVVYKRIGDARYCLGHIKFPLKRVIDWCLDCDETTSWENFLEDSYGE